MEKCNSLEGLSKKREFPKNFTENFYQESKIIHLMTEIRPEKRPSAAKLLDRSAEF